MLDKKQIWAVFLFEFKMFCKAAETTHNINNAFGSGTANGCTAQWWFKKFCKGDKSLEDEHSGWPSEGDNIDHSLVVQHLKQIHFSSVAQSCPTLCSPMDCSTPGLPVQIRKVKKLDEWVPHELTTNQKKKKLSFWSVIFSYSTQQQTISWWIVMRGKKWILYDNWQWPAQ